jgi:putative endonuclease
MWNRWFAKCRTLLWPEKQIARGPEESVGDFGERLATNFLVRKGYQIVARNERNLVGELDIIAVQKSFRKRVIVFVEVKTWTHTENGSGPSDAVDDHKQKQITGAALVFLRSKRLLEYSCRFDVVAVTLKGHDSQPEIRHFENAFEAVGMFQLHR